MDPQMMIAQMRGDFRLNRKLTIALVALVFAGLLSWLPALWARATQSSKTPYGKAVLSDPFANGQSSRREGECQRPPSLLQRVNVGPRITRASGK